MPSLIQIDFAVTKKLLGAQEKTRLRVVPRALSALFLRTFELSVSTNDLNKLAAHG